MHLELRFFATFRAAVGRKTVEREFPDGSTVGDVLAALESEYHDMEGRLLDDDGAIREQLSILKNGRGVVHMDGAATPLSDGDSLSVFPPVAGGTDATDDAIDGSRAARREKSFRGISKRLAVHYLENLGGTLVAGDPEGDGEARVEADEWTATLSAAKVGVAGGTLKLTEVTIAFEGAADRLEALVERFSQKAMRAGG